MVDKKRRAGVLLPISSLPSPYGIGTFSVEAYRFVDLLCEAGQSVWQILPLCPTSYGDSPYQSPCSFAGNPYFIDPDALVRDRLLTSAECEEYSADTENGYVDYKKLYEKRYPLLRRAYDRFAQQGMTAGYADFLAENSTWLEDYALFMAIKNERGGAPLSTWEDSLKKREPKAMSIAESRLSYEIGFWKFVEFKFFEGWRNLKKYANERGIEILGDIPIYVSSDSVEVWTSPDLFLLDREGYPLSVAGCPPDTFCESGQLWGNPLYNWSEHKNRRYGWWTERIAHAFSMYDILRIDHFRGFESYYSIPYGAPDARGGHWERGPGAELFLTVKKSLPDRQIIAEDLGYITDGVRRMVNECGFDGMKILQFGFDGGDMNFDSEYLPHNYKRESVTYTGTHDNPTLYEWLDGLSAESERMLRRYIVDAHTPKYELGERLIALAMQSPSELCVIPLQDYLRTGREGRMNTPSKPSDNWAWRMRQTDISFELSQRIRDLTEIGGRALKNE